MFSQQEAPKTKEIHEDDITAKAHDQAQQTATDNPEFKGKGLFEKGMSKDMTAKVDQRVEEIVSGEEKKEESDEETKEEKPAETSEEKSEQ